MNEERRRGGLRRSVILAALGLLGLSGQTCLARADGLPPAVRITEPYTLTSTNGVLNLLMIARPATLTTLKPQQPQGFIYDVCVNPGNGATACPPPPPGVNQYAGPRLKLMQGDTVNIHFVNQLPPLTDSKHAVNAEEPGEEFLSQNPTNIHTHGLMVSPHYPAGSDMTYGDNVFVLTFNSANGAPGISASAHADVRMDSTDYSFKIPSNHPSGLFWFHPHVHGISLNQISAGLAGMITVGSPLDYTCVGAACSNFAHQLLHRHLLLKDLQVLADGTRMDQPDTTMCLSPVTGGLMLPTLPGYCAGQDFSSQDGPNYTGAKWFLSVNGQPYPSIPIKNPGGEIWSIVNASGSNIQNLVLFNPATGKNVPFQVLAVDGVSVHSATGQYGSAKFSGTLCPGVTPSEEQSITCTDRLMMMPSARAEIWVSYRDQTGAVVTPPDGARMILRSEGYNTGPAGDTWPAVDLAAVNFDPINPGAAPHALLVQPPPSTLPGVLAISQDLNQTNATAQGPNDGVVLSNCQPLAPGHRRRIYFNVPADYSDLFGLGYEEVDQNGVTVPGTFRDVSEFNSATPTVCLSLGPNNAATTETWELVNLAGEDHSFHIHQTKFSVLSVPSPAQDGTSVPLNVDGVPVLVDNVPVPRAQGTTDSNSPYFYPNSPGGCASAADWKAGNCKSIATVVKIPFYIAGDYVYHCHILEHEDGGMMARIRVLPNNSTTNASN